MTDRRQGWTAGQRTYSCRECEAGSGFKVSRNEQGVWYARPCPVCNKSQHDRWERGAFRPKGAGL